MGRQYGSPQPCECCGKRPADVVYGEADERGHTWTHHVCAACKEGCTSDEDGSPVHLGARQPVEAAHA